MKLGKQSMWRMAFWALAGVVALGAAIQKGYAQGGGPPGGSILAIAIDPRSPDTLYAGTSSGGVFKTTNGGASWTASNTGLTALVLSVQALAVAPSNPATLYAGTNSGGVFKSSNRGASWQPTGASSGNGALPPPQLTQGAVVNGASFAAGTPVAPGSIISIFGSNLAPSALAASSTPLPTGVLATSVTINGVPIPLYYVSPTQINAQVPFETPTGTATLGVTVNGVLSPAVTLPVSATAPGIFLYGSNRAVAQNPDGSINASNNPAKPGDVIVLYMTGQGAVSNPIPSGAPALANPLSVTLATTTATIGGTNAQVLFSGLTPGLVGLLQVNIRIPNVAAGDQPLLVTMGGAASNSALITVGAP